MHQFQFKDLGPLVGLITHFKYYSWDIIVWRWLILAWLNEHNDKNPWELNKLVTTLKLLEKEWIWRMGGLTIGWKSSELALGHVVHELWWE